MSPDRHLNQPPNPEASRSPRAERLARLGINPRFAKELGIPDETSTPPDTLPTPESLHESLEYEAITIPIGVEFREVYEELLRDYLKGVEQLLIDNRKVLFMPVFLLHEGQNTTAFENIRRRVLNEDTPDKRSESEIQRVKSLNQWYSDAQGPVPETPLESLGRREPS